MTGFALSQTTPEAPYTYALTVETTGPDTASLRQGGRFRPAGGVPDTLGVLYLKATSVATATIRLDIADKRGVRDHHVREVDFADYRTRFTTSGQGGAPGKTSATGVGPHPETSSAPVATVDQQEPPLVTEDAPAVSLELDGLVIDETRTKPGRDFYGYFYAAWQAPVDVSDYTIKLREAPGRGRISRVNVVIDGAVVYRSVLQPRQSVLAAVAQQAAGVASRHLLQRDQLGEQLDPDQAGDGLY